jgi:hypothetical protein
MWPKPLCQAGLSLIRAVLEGLFHRLIPRRNSRIGVETPRLFMRAHDVGMQSLFLFLAKRAGNKKPAA